MTKSTNLMMAAMAAAVLAFAPSAEAQTGSDALRFSQRLPLSSPGLVGSAGVGTAGRGDLSDLFGNPAGLGWMSRGMFALSLNTSNVQDDAIYTVGGGSAFSTTSDLTSTRLGNLSYAYKLPTSQGSMVIAAGVSQVSSFQRSLAFEGDNGLNSVTDYLMPLADEFSLFQEGDEVVPEFTRPLSFIGFETFAIDLDGDAVASGDAVPFLPAVSAGTVRQSGLVSEEGQMNEFAVGGAIEAAEGVMAGLTLNVPFGEYRFNQLLDEDDVFDDNDGTGGTTDFQFLTLAQRFESRLVGINLRGGVSAKLSNNLRMGLSLETPTWLTVSEDYDTRLLTSFDNGDAFEYGDGVDEDAGRGSFDYDIRTPWRLGAGLAYNSGKLTVAGDVELVDWSQLELDSESFSFADQNLAIRRELQATVNARVGASYRFDKVEVRGGLAIQPDPRTEVTGVERDRGVAALGLSYRVNSQFVFDLGLMTEIFDDEYSPYSEVADAPLVTEEIARNFVTLGVRVGL